MSKILELGCGKGRHAEFLRKKFDAEVYAVDISPENISVSKSLYPDVNFAVMKAENLQFPDGNFDSLYALDVLEHVDGLEDSLSEISRVLKPGGKLVINVPAKRSELWLQKIRPTYPAEMHHIRIFSGTELEDGLEKLSLKLQVKTSQGFTDHLILYYLMTRPGATGDHQLGIGNWRDTWLGRIIFSVHAFSKPNLVFESWLKFIPLWLIGIPLGWLINYFGNKVMPKSVYYEFIKE